MTTYWQTEEAQQRSKTASKARNSNRNGLGPHRHLSGQKSYSQIKDEMEEKLGRPVSIGEVFIMTHTKSDGTFVDLKAQTIAETYEKKLQAKLAELSADCSENSDGVSQPRQLTSDEYNELFLQSTVTNERGCHYGVGSLKNIVKGKRKHSDSSSSFLALQEQLAAAERKIEEQAAYNARRDEEIKRRDEEIKRREAELSRVAAEQENKIKRMQLVEKFLSQTNPQFIEFLASESATSTTDPITTVSS